MIISSKLQERSNSQCELCGNTGDLFVFTVPPKEEIPDNQVVLCSTCHSGISDNNFSDEYHWRCLEGSIWSEVPAVQALSYKVLKRLDTEWAIDATDAANLDEALINWALAEENLASNQVIHKDSYGSTLLAGDTVVLTQNLNVKGTSYIAPKGTVVRKIRLVADNEEQIEGKINGDTIVILTKFVKRQV